MSANLLRGGAIWWTLTKERQAWCNLQVKLCDPCLSALWVWHTKMALYKYSTFRFLSFSWLGSVLRIPFSALSLLVVQQAFALKNLLWMCPHVLPWEIWPSLEWLGTRCRRLNQNWVIVSACVWVSVNVGCVPSRVVWRVVVVVRCAGLLRRSDVGEIRTADDMSGCWKHGGRVSRKRHQRHQLSHQWPATRTNVPLSNPCFERCRG